MALLPLRIFYEPAKNRERTVYYNDATRAITVQTVPIDPSQPTSYGAPFTPNDGLADGTEITRFCEGIDQVVITAVDTTPFALVTVNANSLDCGGSTLTIVRITGFAPVSPATTGKAEVQADGGTAPYTVTINSTTVTADGAGLATVTGLAPGSYPVTLTDAAATSRSGTVTIPGAVINGCTLPGALNYDPAATDNDGSCEFVAVDVEPAGLVAAHLPIPVELRAAPIGGQPALVHLFVETAPVAAGPWVVVGELAQPADPQTAAVAFNASETCKSLFLLVLPPVETGLDPNLSRLVRLRYVVRSAAGMDTYAGTLAPFRVLNAAEQPPIDGVLSYPVYDTRPVGSVLWQNVATLDAVSADEVDVPANGGDWPCPYRQFVWLNRLGGWDTGFFTGRHQHGTDQQDPVAFRDTAGADRYASGGTDRDTLQVYSDKLDFATYQALRFIRRSIQVYERTGVNQYVPVLVTRGSFTEYQEQRDKTFEVNFTISYPPVLIQTQ